MNKNFLGQFILCILIFAVSGFGAKVIQVNRLAATPAFKLLLAGVPEETVLPTKISTQGTLKSASSGQRVVEYNVLEQTSLILAAEEYDTLLRIVEAEAGSEDEKGRMLVAGVVLNRVKSKKFPDTVKEVVFQQQNGTCQFSPISTGSFYTVKISEETIGAVDKVLAGEDVTEGALYFASRKYAAPEKMAWFDNNLTPLFSYGGHEFFY